MKKNSNTKGISRKTTEKVRPLFGKKPEGNQKTATQKLLTQQITVKKSKPSFFIHSFSLAKDNQETLADLTQTATDAIGRPISSSALLRALLRFLAQQPESWIATQLHPQIEEEITKGRTWGRKTATSKQAVHR